MNHADRPPPRLKSLDCLRLGLALLIMVTHARRVFDIELPLWLTKGLLDGKAGVVMFFVLSGHVLAKSLANKPVSWESCRQFWIKRVFRLFPLYWVALLLTFVVLSWIKAGAGGFAGDDGSVLFLRQDDAGWHQWLLHLALVVPGMQAEFALPTVWSLMTEAKVSLLVFPFLGWAVLRLPVWCAAALTGLLVLGSDFLFHHVIGTAAYLGMFALGALLARVPAGWWRRLPVWGWWCLLLAGCAAYSCLTFRSRMPSVWMGYYLCALGAAGIIACVSCWPALSRRMHAVYSILGVDVSYGIYLLHYPVLLAFFQLGGLFSVAPSHTPALVTAAMAATAALAWVLAHAVEIPMIKLGRQLAGKRREVLPACPIVRDVSP